MLPSIVPNMSHNMSQNKEMGDMALLFTPFTFRNIYLRNRVVMPPMATAIEGPGGSVSDDGMPSNGTIAHYARRAENGVGMVIVEHTYVDKSGKAHKGQLGIDSDDAVSRFEELAAAIKSGGAFAVIQLSHAGAATSVEVTVSIPLGPSEVPVPGRNVIPRAMTREDIAKTVNDFALAARRAKNAGFQGVEVHAAHGYLLNQFLSPLTNKRTDEYGGSLSNRARFLLEVVEHVQESVGEDFPVFVRLGSVDGIEGGIVPEDAAFVAAMLEDAGVALIDVSGAFAGSRPKDAPPGYYVPAAAVVKNHVNIPVLVAGGITDPYFAEQILQEKKTDLVGIGRALLRDPEWVIKAEKLLEV